MLNEQNVNMPEIVKTDLKTFANFEISFVHVPGELKFLK